MVDGVYYGQGRVINEGFFDMKQVEILKGPQALFFGKNATAGAIAFTTANPGTHFEALARAGYEFEAGESRIEGIVSGPITDTVRMRVAVRGAFMDGGYVANNANATTYTSFDVANGFAATVHDVPAPVRDVPEQEDVGGRVTLQYAPTDDSVFAQYDPADPLSRITADQNFDNVSPEAALTWTPQDRLTIYAAYKEGFKSGGFSGSAINSLVPPRTTTRDLAFEPELASGYEAGLRLTSSDDRLRWAATLFRYEYDDFQVDFFDTSRVTYITFNAATARTQGIELQAEWSPAALDALTLSGSLNYTDAEFTDFIDAPCYSGQSPAQGCTVGPLISDPSTTRASQDLTGKPTALAPKWTGSLGLNYTTDVGGNLTLQASVNARYSSKYFLNGLNNPLATQGTYTTADASFALRSRDGSWEIALIGRNLTDKYVLTSAIDAPNTGVNTGLTNAVPADQLGTPEPPRTIAVQFTYKH